MARGSLNKVMLIGRLGTDPELKYTPQGSPVCNFSLATDESYKDQQGNTVDRTEWHRIVLWRKLAEISGQYLRKGSLVYIEGKLTTRSWEQEGQKKYTTEIVADSMTMLGNKQENAGATGGNTMQSNNPNPGQQNASQGNTAPPPPQQQNSFDVPQTDFNEDDDLPF
jgi:single-strand DNA-binding protein